MSKVFSIFKLVVLCSLAALVVGAASSAPASASEEMPFETPSLKVCKEVPSGALGLYTESKCATNARSGNWDWATADTKNNTWFCLLWTNGPSTSRFSDSLCEALSAGGQFEKKLFNVAFPKLLGTSGLSVLKGELVGVKAEVDCTGDKFNGQPETGGLSGEVTITYTGCTAPKPKSCEVKSKGEPVGTIATTKLMGTLSTVRLITFTPEASGEFVGIEYSGAECALKGNTFTVEGSQMCTFAADIGTPAVEHELACAASESNLLLGKKAATYEGNALIMVAGSLLWKNH